MGVSSDKDIDLGYNYLYYSEKPPNWGIKNWKRKIARLIDKKSSNPVED